MQLNRAALAFDSEGIKQKMQEIVPEYTPNDTKSVLRN